MMVIATRGLSVTLKLFGLDVENQNKCKPFIHLHIWRSGPDVASGQISHITVDVNFVCCGFTANLAFRKTLCASIAVEEVTTISENCILLE